MATTKNPTRKTGERSPASHQTRISGRPKSSISGPRNSKRRKYGTAAVPSAP
jgi:hypothetical protein